jgi:hypothetical protein
MTIRRIATFSLLIFCLTLTPALAAEATKQPKQSKQADKVNQASKAMQHYSQAQGQWHSNLAQLVTSKKPEFTPNAMSQRNLQLSMLSLRNARFRYLLRSDPERLEFNKGVNDLSNFDWTDKDSRTLSVLNPDYEKLEISTQKQRAANDKLPNWDEFRAFFKTDLSKAPEYKKLLDELTAAQEKADKILEAGR